METLSEYNPKWPIQYQQAADLIKKALSGNLQSIHHIGSTSVESLIAKPKIDIIAAVNDLEFNHVPLNQIGYTYRGGFNLPFRKSFTYRSSHLNINLHIFESSDPEIELNLKFRDYLRSNAMARSQYIDLKMQLADSYTKPKSKLFLYNDYTLGKHEWILSTIEKAGFKRVRMTFCSHPIEWNAAIKLRNKYFFDPQNITDPYEWTFEHKDHKHCMLYLGTKIIGYCHIQYWPKNRAALRMIAIDSKYQNKGYGSQFIQLIEKWLRLKKIKILHTQTQEYSLSFYLKAGYKLEPFNDPDNTNQDPSNIDLAKSL